MARKDVNIYGGDAGSYNYYSTIGSNTGNNITPGGVNTGVSSSTTQYTYQTVPQYNQQFGPITTIPVPPAPWESTPVMTPEEREGAIEFMENLMFLLQAILDEHDVPNKGGTMDRTEFAVLEAVIDLGDTEIVIRPKL